MINTVLGAELYDVRVPVGIVRTDLAQNTQSRGVFDVGIGPRGLPFGGVAFLHQQIRIEELIGGISRSPSSCHANPCDQQRGKQDKSFHKGCDASETRPPLQ